MLTIREAIEISYQATSQHAQWDSLVINKRKPHTYRAFMQHEDSRICLHRFEACEPEDSFAHPHPWPSSMIVLAGKYDMNVAHTADLESKDLHEVIRVTLGPGSIYHMNDRHTWQVIPRSRCFSLMVNGPRWEYPHTRAPSTSGKGLETMTAQELAEHLETFRELLNQELTPE